MSRGVPRASARIALLNAIVAVRCALTSLIMETFDSNGPTWLATSAALGMTPNVPGLLCGTGMFYVRFPKRLVVNIRAGSVPLAFGRFGMDMLMMRLLVSMRMAILIYLWVPPGMSSRWSAWPAWGVLTKRRKSM